MAKVIAIIMAGGQGSRLYPLTKFRSKPAVPIAGRFRLIDIPISNCIHSGYRRIFILTQFASESLHRHIFLTYRFDAFHQDFVTILSAQQTMESRNWYQGTADAVRQNLDYFENLGDPVLILSGDHLYRMDYRKFVDFHVQSGADISISVIPVKTEEVKDVGVMKVDRTGRIIEFREKPREVAAIEEMKIPEDVFRAHGIEPRDRTHLASMGVYLFNWKTLREVLENTTDEDFGRQVIPRTIHNRKVFGYFFDGYWEDIGTIPSFFKANLNLTEPLPRFNFYDEEKPIFTHARFLPGSKILASEVENSILCEGSIINSSSIRRSIIGIRSRIGENSRIERTVMMGADFFESKEELTANIAGGIPPIGIGRESEILNAIIDKNARIGNGVKLVNIQGLHDRSCDAYCIINGIIVVPKNTVIPDGTVI
jgi:glucose-1-phosphate adenylyltransferase